MAAPASGGFMTWIDSTYPKVAAPTRAARPRPWPDDRARHERLPDGTSPSDPHRHGRRRATATQCARALVAGLSIWRALCGASWTSQADLVVVGPVVTMAASTPHARGLAVAGGKI